MNKKGNPNALKEFNSSKIALTSASERYIMSLVLATLVSIAWDGVVVINTKSPSCRLTNLCLPIAIFCNYFNGSPERPVSRITISSSL